MTSPTHSNYLPVRQDWLDHRREPAVDPELPIVDAHHHLWDRPGWRYLIDEFLADIKASAFWSCSASKIGSTKQPESSHGVYPK